MPLKVMNPESTCRLKFRKDFPGHEFQSSAHVGHRNAAEIDHADYVSHAGFLIFPEDLFRLRWSSEDNEALSLELVEIGDLRSRSTVRLGE